VVAVGIGTLIFLFVPVTIIMNGLTDRLGPATS